MILDALLLLSGSVAAATGVLTGQTVTGTDTSVLSTNTIDLASLALGGNQAPDEGSGESLEIAINTLVAASGGTSVQFQLIQADNAALSTNVEVLAQSGAIAVAKLTVGKEVYLKWPPASPYAPRRYIGVRYVTVGAVAAGAYTAAVVKDKQNIQNRNYASGYVVA